MLCVTMLFKPRTDSFVWSEVITGVDCNSYKYGSFHEYLKLISILQVYVKCQKYAFAK